MSEANQIERPVRQVSERDIACALVLEYAESGATSFALMGFYDDDAEFLGSLADRLGVPNTKAFTNKLTKVVRRLVNYGVLYAQMSGTNKEYFGEPEKQMNYTLKTSKAALIRRGKTEHTMEPEGEVAFLLRHAYPAPDA